MADQSILIVEDEQVTALEIQAIMQDLEYTVLEPAETGEHCLEVMENNDVGLVLMDIRLPGRLDGIETTREITERFGDIPVLYISAYSDTETLEEAQKTEPSGFLIKPVSENDLSNSVESVFGPVKK